MVDLFGKSPPPPNIPHTRLRGTDGKPIICTPETLSDAEFYCLGIWARSPLLTASISPSGLRFSSRWQAVIEESLETEDYYGRKKPPRDRFLGGVVTPSMSAYITGAIKKDFVNYLENESCIAPQLGVSFSESTGISVSSTPQTLSNLSSLHTYPAFLQFESRDLF